MPASNLRGADVRGILGLIGAAHEAIGSAELAGVLLQTLPTLVRCDLVSYNAIDLGGGATQTFFEPAVVPRPEIEKSFALLAHEHPLVRAYAESQDPRALRMSDFVSLAELRRLDIYNEVFLPLETDHQLAFSVAITANTVIGIGLNRRRTDFSDRDVAVIAELQPHLAAAFHHAGLKDEKAAELRQEDAIEALLLGLTGREREIALLVATGQTNRCIARILSISERTVEKHIANALHKLGLHSRVALAHAITSRAPLRDKIPRHIDWL